MASSKLARAHLSTYILAEKSPRFGIYFKLELTITDGTAKMTNVRCHLLAAILLISFNSFAETIDKEALENSMDSHPAETLEKIELLLQRTDLSEEDQLELLLIKASGKSTLGYQEEYLSLSEEGVTRANALNHFMLASKFKLCKADALSQMSQWPESKSIFSDTISELGEADDRVVFGQGNMMFGLAAYYNGEFELALLKLTEAYEIFLQFDENLVPTALHNIALVYDATNDQVKAIKYFKKSLEYFDTDKEELRAGVTYYNIGYVSVRIDDLETGEEYLKKSIAIAEKYKQTQGVAFGSAQMANLEMKRENFQLAKQYFVKAVRLARELKNNRLETMSLIGMLDTQIQLKEFEDVSATIFDLKKFLKEDSHELKIRLLKLTTEMHIEQANYKGAVEEYQQIIEALEHIMKESKQKAVLEIQSKFDTRIQEQENEILRQKNELQALRIIEQKKDTLVYIISGITLLIIIFSLGLFSYREKKVREKMAKLAMTDELTGVANRRHITQRAEEEFDRFKRYQAMSLFCLMDLDLFKQVNDNFGHDVGDEVLKTFAGLVSNEIRELDWFGRVGGEEWMLVLPQATLEHVETIFNRVTQLCERIDVPEGCRPISFSMGVSIPQDSDENLNAIIKRADEALYQAKENGRNCYFVLPE